MADQAEDIGGISVSLGVEDQGLDAELAAALQKMQSFAQQAERLVGAVPIGTQMAPQAPQAAATARRASQAPQAPQITIGPAAASWRGSASSFNRAINAELAKEGMTLDDSGNVVPIQQRRTARPQRIEAGDISIETPNVNVTSLQASDTAVETLTASVNELTEALRNLHAEAQKPVEVRTREAPQAADLEGERATSRRAPAVPTQPVPVKVEKPVEMDRPAGAPPGTIDVEINRPVPVEPAPSVQQAPTEMPVAPLAPPPPPPRPPTAVAAPPEDEDEPQQRLRRRNIRDRGVGTEADPNRIYTFEPDEGINAGRMIEPGPAQQGMSYVSYDPMAGAAEEERRAEVAAGRARDRDRTQREQQVARERDQRLRNQAAITSERLHTEGPGQGPGLAMASTTFDIHGAPPLTQSNQPPVDPQERERRQQANQRQQREAEQERQRQFRARRRASILGETDPILDRSLAVAQRARREIDIDEEVNQRVLSQRARSASGAQTGRTFASSLGALFGGTRGAQIQAEAEARVTERRLDVARRTVRAFVEGEDEIRERFRGTDAETQKVVGAEIKRFRNYPLYKRAVSELTEATDAHAAAEAKLEKLQGPVAIARNLVSITAAGAAFGLGLQAINFATEALVPALQQAADVASGFGATSTRVTTALAQQTAAAQGNVEVVLAQQAAQAGLSKETSDYLSSQLRLTTQVKAGAIAQQQTSEMFRAAIGLGGGTPQGLIGGYGGLFGSALFGEQMGGGKGFAETILGDLENIGVKTGAIRRLERGRPGQTRAGEPMPPEIVAPTEDIERYINDLNDAGQRGADYLREQGAKFRFTQDPQELEAARNAGETASKFADLGYVLSSLDGQVISTTAAFEKALAVFASGKSLPDFETMFKAQRPAIEAQVRAANESQRIALQRQIPAQAALGAMARPPLPVGTGIAPEDQRSVQGVLIETTGIQQKLNSYYAAGASILRNDYKIPPALLQDVTATGKAIAQTQAAISNEQAAYQVAQYNFQLHIARRSLTDIQQITGQIGATTGDNLGLYERQNLLLGRQAQQFQFALTQRQINFRTALAGFQAPGVTPAERRARMEEAKIEASFAQKQLDLSKAQFQNQVKIVDIGNLRQATDLAAQINLMIQGRQVTIDTAAAEQKLARLSELQQLQVAAVGTYINKVDTLTSSAISNIASLEAATGRAISRTQAQGVLAAYAVGQAFYRGASGGLLPEMPPGRRGAGGSFASGVLGTATSATTLTVGEAGAETVAVLRNPRTMLTGGVGGGGNTVNFNGPMYIRDEADITEIARKVEEAMGRKASLIGLRAPG